MSIESTEQIENVEQETPSTESVDTGVKNSAKPKDVAPNVPPGLLKIAKEIQNGGEGNGDDTTDNGKKPDDTSTGGSPEGGGTSGGGLKLDTSDAASSGASRTMGRGAGGGKNDSENNGPKDKKTDSNQQPVSPEEADYNKRVSDKNGSFLKRKENGKKMDDTETLIKRNEALQERYKKRCHELVKQVKENEGLKSENEGLRSQIGDLRSQIGVLESTITQLKKQLDQRQIAQRIINGKLENTP